MNFDDEEYRRWYEDSNEYKDKQYAEWYEELKREKRMGYLYLNFCDNLENGSKSRNDFYTVSLSEQYKALKQKIGLYAPDTLQEFIAHIFPVAQDKTYYISLPAFRRSMRENFRGKQCVFNIVIRPERDMFSSHVLPENYDVIIIGDVTFGSVIDITVKGLELIDKNVAKFGEKRVRCTAACAFATKSFPDRTGRNITVPDYGTREMHDPVLTNDFVNNLCNGCYPVPDFQESVKTLEKWRKYIEFRKYYLGNQSERCEEIDEVTVCNAYMIAREAYKRNEENYSQFLLDGIEDFAKGEQVVLSKDVNGADGFPLICVVIRKNRKQILSETVGRNGKGKSKYESWLRRYTNEAMGLSPTQPKYDENGKLKGKFFQYLLGERYLFAYVDIAPDFSALEKKFDADMQSAYKSIDNKYDGIISGKVNKFMQEQELVIKNRYNKRAEEYKSALAASLEQDIRENSDKEILREIEAEIKRRIAPFADDYKRRVDKIKSVIDELKRQNKKEDNESAIEAKTEELKFLQSQFENEKERIAEEVDARPFYVARNNRRIESNRKSLDIECQTEIEKRRREKRYQLEIQYKSAIEEEKTAARKELEQKLAEDKAEKTENETVREYRIYFRPQDITDKISALEKQIEEADAKFLTYDNRAEKAKIERQEKALNSFLDGYVKNPYLPSYLFASETLAQSVHTVDDEPEWCLESLNDRQKTAVKRALASDSIFLLQGPPGTGKTQVIAEITAQLARRGKKVLISSETHKAIDNVFERLPKIPEIRPLRLIPSQNGKETNYSPERLVDNFYLNISGSLEKQINRFEHFAESKATFDEDMKKLRIDYDRLLTLKNNNMRVERERSDISKRINALNDILQTLRNERYDIENELERFRRTIKYIESYKFVAEKESVREEYIERYITETNKLIERFPCLKDVTPEKIGDIVRIDDVALNKELSDVLSEDSLVVLKNRQKELRDILQELRDSETDEAPKEGQKNYPEYKTYQGELIEVGKQIKKTQNIAETDLSDSFIFKFFPSCTQDKEFLKRLPDDLHMFRRELSAVVAMITATVRTDMSETENEGTNLGEQITQTQSEINRLKQQYEELGADSGIEEYGELNAILRQRVTQFFRDFGIVREYKDLDEAFDIIREEWNKLEKDKNTQKVNSVKIPIYRSICKYLSQEDILEEDRQAYTRELYDNVNVFGITCTSRDKFTKGQLEELGRYGIESVDIRSQGIDVVIVDEVSKSSFLDLLIPILYGKTVILVGDHRQLPPMYDLRNMRENDFEGLDENIITKQINDGYTALYEECFFKTLYEKVPNSFRTMLNRQYRCHSHIMEVFNHFYGGNAGNQQGLIVGKVNQDDEKQHNLTVRINGHTVIDPQHHIYFVDCDGKESSAYEGSTSKINEQEAEVAITLLKALDEASAGLVKSGKLRVNAEKKIDECPSVGVICTYGDQAGLIKKKRKYKQFTGFSQKSDEKLIISTVDDFQGDERDIIIVSMVRNPAQGRRFDAEFIKKFERINVALSRARKLLIIVGSKKFLSENGIIDLPDLNGRRELDKHNFPVYREIIDTVAFRGRILVASDIIGETDNGR